MKKVLFLVILVTVLMEVYPLTNLFGQEPDLPQYTGYVNDFADIISEKTEYAVTALLAELERKTTAQVAVVTIGTVQPFDIETYAVRLFEKWGIGRKGKDNGALLLVALRDRKMRIEVGYGLEGAIPDAIAKIIISDYITPSFKEGDYDTGIAKGIVAIAKLAAKEYNIELSEYGTLPANVSMPEKQVVSETARDILLLLLIILILMLLNARFWWYPYPSGTFRRRDGGYWYGGGYRGSSGGFSGGFGGFGGGFSGGGGASGGW